MPTILFYLFAILMIAGGVCVVALKNPVSSAMGMIGSFIGLAALLIGLNAYFVGTIAAGIIIPLLFVLIMLPIFGSVSSDFKKLDGKALVEASEFLKEDKNDNIAENSIIVKALRGEDDLNKPANPKNSTLPDVNLIGQKLFTDYNFLLQVVAVLLLVATIGCVTLSKKLHGDEPATETDHRMAKTLAKSKKIPEVAKTSTNSLAENTEVADVSEDSAITEQPEFNLNPKPDTVKEVEPIKLPENAKSDEKLGVIYDKRPDYADDLVIINGVGPVIEDKLNGFGVYTFKQIAEWTPEIVSEFDDIIMATVSLTEYLFFSGLLFAIGLAGVIIRRNIIVIFMCLEMMLAAASLTLVAFSRANLAENGLPDYDGQMLVFFIITVAAAEVAVGLAIIVALYRARKTISTDDLNSLKN